MAPTPPGPGAGAAWRFSLELLPFAAAEAGALRAAARPGAPPGALPGAPDGYIRDGLLLRHREARYCPAHASPLLLRWRDAACSARPLRAAAAPRLRLRAAAAGGLETADEPPVTIGRLHPAAAAAARAGEVLTLEVVVGGAAWGGPACGTLLPLPPLQALVGGAGAELRLVEGTGGEGPGADNASRVAWELAAWAGGAPTLEALAGAEGG